MEVGEIMNLNWNRISMLSRLNKKNELQQAEYSMRIAFQNKFGTLKKDKAQEEELAKEIEKTLDKDMIRQIRSYLKEN